MSQLRKRIIPILLAAILLIPSGWLATDAQAAGSPQEESTVTKYHETFEGGQGAATQAGGARLTPVSGKFFAGNEDGAALYVSNRANNWDAADFKFADIGLENGKTYTVTVSVYVDAEELVPDGAQVYLQTVNSYGWLAGAELTPGRAATLTKEFTVDTGKDSALRVQSNDPGAGVPFYIGDVKITAKADSGGEDPPREPALPFAAVTFEDQTTGGFEGRAGSETLTVTNEANHTEGGAYALKVEGRTSTWHGPSLRVEKYVDKGREYKISAWVKLIEPASSQLQLSTQVGSGSGANYVALAPKTISADDGWVLFEGTYRYNSVGGEYLTIYVESSNNASASFYIDDIQLVSTGSDPTDIQRDLTPVKEAYRDDFLIGGAISAEDLEGVRLELLKMHHNVATAGNAMKPDALQREQGKFTFDAADAMVDKILAEGMKMHGHVLVWHQQSPAWMNTTIGEGGQTVPLGREEALRNLRTHIKTVVEHFGDRVISWDVVNEAMSDNPPNPADWEGSLRKSPWYQAIGPDYLEQAFLAAREVLDEHPDWDIKLYYNDYNEDNRNKAQAIYHMVKEINERYAAAHNGRLLIDGIGMQGHYNVNTNPENVRLSLEQFISLGVEVSITELDIQAGSDYRLPENLAKAQGYLYAQLMNLFKTHAAQISRVTFWGLDDGTSWRASSNPLLFDKNQQAKPAYYGVIDPAKYIREYEPELPDSRRSTAAFATPVIDGTVDPVWSLAPALPVDRYQLAWQGATGTAKALWDERNLYVLVEVSDAQLDKSSANVWEQDSVEIFLDENNAKTSFYQNDDGQFRVNFDNESSFSPESRADGFVSAARVSGTNYTVEVKIPFKTITPNNDKGIGLDVQINDAKDGARQSVATWNDTTGNAYQDTSVFGVVTLKGKPGDPNNGGGNSGGGGSSGGNGGSGGGSASPGGSASQPGGAEPVNGLIRPEVKVVDGLATAAISSGHLQKALEQAATTANGKKQIKIEVPKREGAASYEVQLPVQGLRAQGAFTILLDTELAAIEIPGSLLPDAAANAKQVTVRVGKASVKGSEGSNGPDATVRERIGDRPVIELGMKADGKVLRWDDPDGEAPWVVSIPYSPAGEEPGSADQLVVLYMNEDGSAVPLPNGRYDATAGAVVFETTRLGTFAVAYVPLAFADLDHVLWAKPAIGAMAARDILKGVGSPGRFAPAESIKKADFIAALVRVLELKGTAEENIGSSVGPDDELSRRDMMELVARALAADGNPLESGGTLDAYPDAAGLTGSAKNSAAALVKHGVLNGKGGKLAPNDLLTRAEAAVILYRIWKL